MTKNLGWLLTYIWKVESIRVRPAEDHNWDVTLTARLSDGRVFTEDFADRHVCWEWVHRPALYATPLDFLGAQYLIQKGRKHNYMPEIKRGE